MIISYERPIECFRTTLLLLFLTSWVSAITLIDFPLCAQGCINNTATQLGGSPSELNFICKSSTFLDSVHACEVQNCLPSDANRIFSDSVRLCEPVGGSNAIGLANITECAQPGLAIATAESGCSSTNWTCICSSQAYTIVAAEYEEQYCTPAERQGILDYTSEACAAVGLELVPPAPGSANITSLLTTPETSVFDLPDCAQPCVDAALLQSGCSPTDWVCICVNPAFVNGDTAYCELQACDIDAQYEILNITGAQCSAIGEALVPATTISSAPDPTRTVVPPLEPATVSLVFPTGNVPGSVPQISNLPRCALFCARNATSKAGGSVTDLGLLCRDPAVLQSIGNCNAALCDPTDQQTFLALSNKLCEPVAIPGIPSFNLSASQISAAYPTTTVVSSLNNVPPCAKPCLVTALEESGCALDDVRCQCTTPSFRPAFLTCQAPMCGILDLQKLLPFTYQRCQPLGINIPASLVSIESDVAYQIPTSTAIVPAPTDLTNAPNDVGSLPFCAQLCIYSAASIAGCNIHDLTCIFRSETFAAYVITCETQACTGSELQVINAYAAGLGASVPDALTVFPSGAALSSILAEATYSAPNPPTVTNAPNNISALPICAQSCVYSAAAAANCNSINDLTCICQNPTFLSSVGNCEQAACSESELEEISAFSQQLCAPTGGIANTSTSNSTVFSPGVTAFTGGGGASFEICASISVGVVMIWLLWAL